jgi:drug/metabolite transporter (DMT)-like permease
MSLVGSYIGLSKVLVAALPVFLLAWLRFGIAAIAMAHWVKRAPGEAPLAPHDRKLLFFESLVGNFLFSICMLFGVAATSALAAGVVMSAIPAAVALLSRVILGERIRPRVWLAIACAAGGVALLAIARHGDASTGPVAPWWGYALLLGAVLCEAFYVVIGKRLTVQSLRNLASSGVRSSSTSTRCCSANSKVPGWICSSSTTGMNRPLRWAGL